MQRKMRFRRRAGLYCQRTGECGCDQPRPGFCPKLRRFSSRSKTEGANRGCNQQTWRSKQCNLGPTNAPAMVQTASLKTPEQARGTVVLDVAGGVLVPDFRGKSLRTALEEAESAGLELEVNGSGVGLDQSPAAGSRIPPGGHVSVHFGRWIWNWVICRFRIVAKTEELRDQDEKICNQNYPSFPSITPICRSASNRETTVALWNIRCRELSCSLQGPL